MKENRSARGFTHRGVEVSFATLRIPTYADGPADPNPPLFGQGVRAIYPYRWQKSFSTRIEQRTYDAVTLRSALIEATILPDWGMHLYRAVDVTTGRDLFHCPAVLKPAHNSIRGAYIGGGVELNFPIGHNAMTWTRTPLHLRRTEEGVQALFFNVDKRSGMSIAAGITLTAGHRGVCFDQYLHNPTPLPQPWYYWLNAGVTPHRSLRFLFPTSGMIGHFEGPFLETKTRYPYPLRHGVDYSRFVEVPEPIGLFSPQHVPGWFGAWYDDWNFGVVRWAPPWQVAGQKFWSWGASEEGMLWGRIGGDQAEPVPEIQSGRPEIQMDRGMMRPYAAVAHREWWMPVSGIGDVRAASRFGALTLAETGKRLSVGVSPAVKIDGCRLLLNGVGVGPAFSLIPGRVFSRDLGVPAGGVESLAIGAPEGTVLAWSKDEPPVAANVDTLYDNPVPLRKFGADALFQRGFHCERTFRPRQARRFYRLALRKDPRHARTRCHLGLLHLFDFNPEKALPELRQALQTDRWDDQALYLHGVAAEWSGNSAQAHSDFCRVAATGGLWVVPAIARLAAESLRNGDGLNADMLLQHGLQMEHANPQLLFLQSLRCRRMGKPAAVRDLADRMDQALGFSLMGRWERSWSRARNPWIHIAAAAEVEDEQAIAAALAYADCGATDDALAMLRRMASPEGRTEAAYLRRWLGDSASAPSEPHKFFGWGRAMKCALADSLAARPDDPVARFALGCLRAETGDIAEAAAQLRKAVRLDSSDPVARTALLAVYLECGRTARAVATGEAAVRLTPPNPLAWVLLDRARAAAGSRNAKWLQRFRSAPEPVLENEEAREALARLCCDQGRHAEAAALLSGRMFHPYELLHDLRNLWVRIHREKALRAAQAGRFDEAARDIRQALGYPPNLQLGRPLRRFDARTLYAAAWISQHAGHASRATAYLRKAAAEDQPDPTLALPWSILAQIRLGDLAGARVRLAHVKSRAQLLIDAAFQPDLEGALMRVVALCRRVERGWTPSLKDLFDPE